MIRTISSGLIKAFSTFGAGKKISQRDVFAYFSAQLGGDGRSLSKSQLKSFLSSEGSKLSPQKRQILTKMLDNWDKIADGKEEITEKDFNKFSKFIFEYMNADMAEDDKEVEKIEKKKEEKKAKESKNKTDSKDEKEEKHDDKKITSDVSKNKKIIPEYSTKDKIPHEAFESPIDFKIS